MKSQRRLGPPKTPMMDPWYTRMSCKPEGRPEVMPMAGECVGACLSMLRRSHQALHDVEPAFLAAPRPSGQPSNMTRRGRERRQGRQPSSRPSPPTTTRLRDHLASSTTTRMTLTASACVLARGRQDDPRSQLQGIEATPSRLDGGLHLPRAGRSRLASLLRACGGHASRLSPLPWPCVMEGRHASGSRNRKALHWVKSSVGSMCIGSTTKKKD